jgi:hypothetical protein
LPSSVIFLKPKKEKTNMTTAITQSRTFRIVLIAIYCMVFYAIAQNLRSQYLWFDEGVQFWISKGLNPDSNPLSPEGNVADVIENNKFYNLDPGGFGILLHFWSVVSSHHAWLRLLPFIFFIGIVAAFIYLAYRWLRNLNVAMVIGFIPILYPMILQAGFEVRAYSMETLGAVLSIVALEELRRRLTYKRLFLWSSVLAIFITSRYSFIIVAFVTSLAVLYLIFNAAQTWRSKIFQSLTFAAPLLVSLAYCYFFALVYQNSNVAPLDYLPYLSKSPTMLFEQFNLFYVILLGICCILYLIRNKSATIKKYELLLFVTIAVNVIFIFLSFLGKHPWSPESSRCISMVVLMLLCLSALIGELLLPLFNSQGVGKYYIVSFLLVFAIFESKQNLFWGYKTNENPYTDLMKTDMNSFNSIYVDRWESPFIRYSYEYGALKHEKGRYYPSKFTFGKGMRHTIVKERDTLLKEWRAKLPKMNDLIQYDLLITPELFSLSNQFGNNDKWVQKENTSVLWIKKNQ